MLTKDDKGWITGEFATKGEFRDLKNEVKGLRTDVAATDIRMNIMQTDIEIIKEGLGRVEGKFDTMMTKLDGIAGTIATVDQENKVGSAVLARHTRQIEHLARKTKVTLPA